ncbi:hypothetical protein EJ08DRAFT_485014 [Tothia fuscella]|uniref:Uncharacterized protein n=1 Tax=Tothia fuscella TaxID=1048955 RepID=A0A9P4NHJ5_9PEZI|nr:hypothetical protein EJ08DRAFT_485014 [Tothia fuscella]
MLCLAIKSLPASPEADAHYISRHAPKLVAQEADGNQTSPTSPEADSQAISGHAPESVVQEAVACSHRLAIADATASSFSRGDSQAIFGHAPKVVQGAVALLPITPLPEETHKLLPDMRLSQLFKKQSLVAIAGVIASQISSSFSRGRLTSYRRRRVQVSCSKQLLVVSVAPLPNLSIKTKQLRASGRPFCKSSGTLQKLEPRLWWMRK